MSIDVQASVRRVDVLLILVTLGLAAFGLITLYSIGAGGTAEALGFARKQALWMTAGLAAMAVVGYFNYGRLVHRAPVIYAASTLSLLLIFAVGHAAQGAQRWIAVGAFRFQPSEFAKLGLIISLAAFLAARYNEIEDAGQVIQALALAGFLMALVIVQPDLGTGLVLAAITLGMLLAAGVRVRHLLLILLVGIVLSAVVLQLGLLQDYQVKRLVVFLNPDIDPADSGYNLRQSMIAIGSGELAGKGLASGTQSRLKFLPARHTDFIFSVIGEEVGFFGGALLLVGFLMLMSRALRVAMSARNLFGVLLAAGIVSMWAFQILINVGMTIGIMPVTGIPLPLISYGGSAMLANMIAVGLLLSIYRHRFAAD